MATKDLDVNIICQADKSIDLDVLEDLITEAIEDHTGCIIENVEIKVRNEDHDEY